MDSEAESTTTTSSSTTIPKTTTSSTLTVTSTSIPAITYTTTIRPTCYDGMLNQGEDEVDCGGPCTACVTPAEKTALCLASKGATVYLRKDSVCIQCKSIRNNLGRYINLINVIDCENEDDEDICDDMLEALEDAGKMKGYPTWDFYGELYPGYSLLRISKEVGC